MAQTAQQTNPPRVTATKSEHEELVSQLNRVIDQLHQRLLALEQKNASA